MGPVSIGVEVQRNTDGDTPSTIPPHACTVISTFVLYCLDRKIYEPRHEKANILHMRKQRRRSASRLQNKDADQLRGNREADLRLCFRYIESTIPLLSKSKILSLQPGL